MKIDNTLNPIVKHNPYSGKAAWAFWKTGVAEADPFSIDSIYRKKFTINKKDRIMTAGSCFAQHIGRYLRDKGLNVMDYEPPPPGLRKELHPTYGFGMFSARYGNIYTTRQLLQLAQEAIGSRSPSNHIWQKDGKYIDGLRPRVEPAGHTTPDEARDHRQYHVSKVNELIRDADLLVYTLGLTEAWIDAGDYTVYPLAPGSIITQEESPPVFYKNFSVNEVVSDFQEFYKLAQTLRKHNATPLKVILTVSPVPLVATAESKHILLSNTYSKAALRVAAEMLSALPDIDYFPSYEIITNPALCSTSFERNMRTIRKSAISRVMKIFLDTHGLTRASSIGPASLALNLQNDDNCDEAILDAFGQ